MKKGEKMSEKSQILIRDIPQNVIEKLDEIVKKESYSSRNQLLIEILERYTTIRNELYYQSIPPIIHSICKAEIDDFNAVSSATVHTVALAAARLLKVAQRLDEYLVDDEQAQAEYNEIDTLIKQIGDMK